MLTQLLAVTFSNQNIGGLLLWFVGLVIACAIVYAIMLACKAPGWMYTVASVTGLVLLLIFVILFFFGDTGTGGTITVH